MTAEKEQPDIRQWCEARGITEIEAMMPDMSGIARGKIMPAAKYLSEEGMRLPESVLLQTVTGEHPDETSTLHEADIDMTLRGDPSTLSMVPWEAEPTAQIVHDCFYADGTPVDMAPRYVLQHVLSLYRERGWVPVLAPELEFYLIKPNLDADYPLQPPIGRSGRAEEARQPYGIDAVNEFSGLFDLIYDYCEAQSIELDTLIHESGAAQMEINLLHGDPLALADQAFFFKRTVREAALRTDIYATFMAKPMEDEPGSAMHMHQSVCDIETGRNLFADEDGQMSELFRAHIGGLQRYLPAAMSFLSPNVNSFRRITRYLAAPINLQWGFDNRTAGLRVPHASPQATRVENRVAGADANPYLAMAASLACGLLGMIDMLSPTEPLQTSAYDLPYELPRSLEESLGLLRGCEPLNEILGERFVIAYSAVKECELQTFLKVISSWEREHLLLNV